MSDNKRIYDLLVKMLRFSLGIDRQKPVIFAEDRNTLLRYARKQAIFPLISNNFESDPKIKEQLLLHVLRFERYESILSSVASCFTREKIVFIPLKGSITSRYYPEPWMRTRSDIDILVQSDRLDRALELMTTQLGFEIDGRNYHDITLRHKSGLFVELHFSLFEKEEKMDNVLSTVWQHVTPKAAGSYEYVMSDTFFLFHQLTHTAYHFANGGCGVRFIVDLWLLEHNLVIDRKELQCLCEQAGIWQFYLQLQKLLQYWFADEKPSELLLQMETYLLDASVFGSERNRVAAAQKRGGKFGFLISRLFWSYKDLKELYPSLDNRKILLPFYQVRRWCRLFDAKKRKQAFSQLSMNSTMERAESKEIQKLISRVGL